MPDSFQSACVIETGLSVFHLMTLTVMRNKFKKGIKEVFKKGLLFSIMTEDLKSFVI